MFQTEYDFTLPMGFLDEEGSLHRDGTMRLATAADEILPLKDPRESRITTRYVAFFCTRLGSLGAITPKTIEGLFAADLAYLQDFYNRINRPGGERDAVTCPQCRHSFEPEATTVGGF